MTSLEQRIRQTLAEMADDTPVSAAPSLDPLRTLQSRVDEPVRHNGRIMTLAVSVLLLAAGLVAIVVVRSRDESGPADPIRGLEIEPDVVTPGEWVTMTADTVWRWEAFLDRVDGGQRERIWMLYPASETFLTPQPPVDLREQPNPALQVSRAIDPLSTFQIPAGVEPGQYQICRYAITAGHELCADLTVRPANG